MLVKMYELLNSVRNASPNNHCFGYVYYYVALWFRDTLTDWWLSVMKIVWFVSLFLCIFTEWSREALLEGWMSNPTECCENSGVKPPENIGSFQAEHQLTTMDSTPTDEKPQEEQEENEDGPMVSEWWKETR